MWQMLGGQTTTPWPQLLSYSVIAAFCLAMSVGGMLATLTFVLLWPAMWFDPLGTLRRMSVEMGIYNAVQRHTTVNYFLGQPIDDPGLLFYPIVGSGVRRRPR